MVKVVVKASPIDQLGMAISGIALILALAWIFRTALFISQYSIEIVYAFIVCVFFTNIIHVKLNQGVFGLVSSLASKLGSFALDTSVAFFFAGFLGLEQQFTNYTLALFIASLLLFIASFIFWRLVVPKRAIIGKEIFSFGKGQIQLADDLKAKTDNLTGMPIRIGNRQLGCISLNDVEFSVNTTLGYVRVPVSAPVLIMSGRLQKDARVRDATEDEWEKAESLYANRRKQLSGSLIKVPFVRVETYEDDSTEVEIGPIRISDTEEGTMVDVPPFIHFVDEEKPTKGRILIASGDRDKATIALARGILKASWGSFRLKTDGNTFTSVRKGGSYAKDRAGSIVIGSPGYELTVSGDNVSLELPDIELMATPSTLVVKAGGKTQRIANEKLSRRLIDAMVDVAKNQVSALLGGAEIDPADVYVEIDSILHGVG